jgi:hypothetical protein
MKTPRELLFERHRSVEPELNALRESVLADMAQDTHRGTTPSRPAPGNSLRALVRSWRWHLAGLSAAWLIVLFLSIDRPSDPASTMAHKNIPAARQLWVSLQAYQQQLLELLGPSLERAAVPQRRSERQPEFEWV